MLELELGERVVDAIDAEARAPIQTLTKRQVEAAHIRREALSNAAHVMGEEFMARLNIGLGTLEPDMPAAAAPPGPWKLDASATSAPETAAPKRRRRVRKARVATA